MIILVKEEISMVMVVLVEAMVVVSIVVVGMANGFGNEGNTFGSGGS
jgi:hypothetical protein